MCAPVVWRERKERIVLFLNHPNDAPPVMYLKYPPTNSTTARVLVPGTATPNAKHHTGSITKKNIVVCAER